MRRKRTTWMLLAIAALLLIPFVAMQVGGDVAWTNGDFGIAGALLLGAGFSYELLATRLDNPRHRLVIGALLAAVLLLVWAQLAVGIW